MKACSSPADALATAEMKATTNTNAGRTRILERRSSARPANRPKYVTLENRIPRLFYRLEGRSLDADQAKFSLPVAWEPSVFPDFNGEWSRLRPHCRISLVCRGPIPT